MLAITVFNSILQPILEPVSGRGRRSSGPYAHYCRAALHRQQLYLPALLHEAWQLPVQPP